MRDFGHKLVLALNPINAARMVFVCLLAVAIMGATDPTARFNRIGHGMMCVCGCGQILLECNHVGCPDSARMIGELHDQLGGTGGTDTSGVGSVGGSASVLSDTTIMNWFVAKYGATVLAAPMRGGFDNVAWIVPITVFLLATIGTAMLVRMWSQKRRPILATPSSSSTNVADEDTRARIRRETQY